MSVFRNISVVISGDAAPLVRAYGEAASATQAFAREQTAAADASTALNRSMSGLAAKIRDVSAAASASSANTARWSESSAAARANVGRLGVTAAEAAGQVRTYTAEAGLAASETAAFRTSATQAANRVLDLGAAAELAAPATATLGAAADEAAAGTAALGAGSRAAAAGTARIAAASTAAAAGAGELGAASAAGAAGVGALSRTTSDAERIAGRLGGSLGLAGAQAGTMGAQITSAATAASRAGQAMSLAGQVGAAGLAIGLIASVAAAMKFDAEMHNVASIDAEVGKNFAATESQILSLSRVLPQSAQTLAEGLYNIASSGFYGSDAMQILGVSARAASAGLTTTDTASKAIVASLNAYGLGASSATRVSDALFSTVNYGVISFGALTSAVANSVGNAAQAKVGIEQLGSALATMTLSGMTASSAGVSLNNLISKLVKPSAALSQEFVKLGISQSDLSDSGAGLYGVMMKLRDSGDANIKTLLAWFPEIRAARGAMALLAGDGATYTRVFSEMGTAQENAGATQRVFAEQMKSTSAQLDLLKNKIEAAGISIGTALLPHLNDAMAGLTSFLGGVERVGAELLSRAEPGFRALGRAIEDVAGVIHDLHVDQLAGDLARLALGTVVVGFDALAAAVSATTGFLHDHESIVVAVALAYGALKLQAVAAGFASLAVSVRAAATAMDAQGALLLYGAVARLTAGITLLGGVVPSVTAGMAAMRASFAFTAAAGSGPLVASLASVRTGMLALSGSSAASVASMGLYGAALVAVGVGLTQLASASRAAKDIVAQQASSFDSNHVNDYAAAIANAHDKQQAIQNDWRVKGNDWADVLFPKLVQEGSAWGNVADTLSTKHDTLAANTAALGAQFGLTQDKVVALADAAGIHLNQSLDVVNSSGTTLRGTFAAAIEPLRLAGVQSDDMAAAMKRLDTATTGADQALKDFDTTLNLLQGNGIAVVQTADGFQKALAAMTTQLSSNTAGLTGNSTAAQANRDAVNAAMLAAAAHGEALTKFTGSADTGAAALGQMTGQIQAQAQAAGVGAGQIDGYTGSVNQLTSSASTLESEVGSGINIPVDLPGIPQAIEDLDATNGIISRLPKFARIDVSTPGALEAMSQLDQTSGILSRIPPSVSTQVSAPGAVQATLDVGGTVAKVDELPAAKATEISAPGATAATDLVWTFYLTTGKLPPAKWTDISAPGATTSTAQTQAFIDTVAAMVAAKATNISAPGATGAKAEVDALRAAVDSLHDKSITVTTVQRQIIEQAYYTASSPGSPALTYGLQGAATGGEIRGPGTPTSDSILARLSDREWVIQAASAAKYGHAAMASINAGTATVIPGPTAGYALGGQVGPVRPPGFAGGGMVSGGGYGGMTLSVGGISIQVVGGPSNADTARAVEDGVQRALGRVVSHIRAGVG